ncbi:MAG TPA: ferritin-like domain-containing protein [bacterium]|nr:ferritin-like domain-containing protein [bacterium]
MTARGFLDELDAENKRALDRIVKGAKATDGNDAQLSVPRLLKLALKNELEAAEIAAVWLVDTGELDVKLAFMRQCGDEARHFRLITERLAALAIDTTALDPRSGGPTELYKFLASLKTTVERVAAGQFTREALALVRNDVFVEFCEASGDETTASLYRDIIQPDEKHHHELGRRLLTRYAVDAKSRAKAKAAAARTLELAEEMQEIARMKGLACIPGC